jgi:hypothetical protein
MMMSKFQKARSDIIQKKYSLYIQLLLYTCIKKENSEYFYNIKVDRYCDEKAMMINDF